MGSRPTSKEGPVGLEQVQAAAHRGVGEAPLVVMPVEGIQPGVQKEI